MNIAAKYVLMTRVDLIAKCEKLDACMTLCEDVFAWNDFDEFREWRTRFEALKGSAPQREAK